MKKFLSIAMVACFMFSLVGCANPAAPTTAPSEAPAPASEAPASEAPTSEAPVAEGGEMGKIAIVTNTVSQNEEEYRSAQQVVKKYGEDKVIHVTWPDNFMTEQEQMVSVVGKIASDPEVKVLIINQAVPGTNAAVDKLLETRKDMFITYCTPQENPPDVASRANLILQPDELKMGVTVPDQAAKLGAKTFVHYSFPRHMSQVLLSSRRELMKEECKKLGIEFVDATAPDPTGDSGLPGAQQFILEDVPKMVAKYGKDTAFFSTNCAMQIPLIKAAVEAKAIYPQPCCPSPYHGFPTALGIETGNGDIQHVIDETKRILTEKGVAGRFSTWPVPVGMMFTNAAADYGVKWMKGEVAKEGIDLEALKACMKDYAGVDTDIATYTDNGTEYKNYLLAMMGFLTY